MYYNTTQQSGEVLERYKEKATNQDQKILDFFRSHPGQYFTPFDVQRLAFNYDVPITSVRRSITNLTQADKLIKSTMKKDGNYGRENHAWTIRGTIHQGTLFN